MAFSPRRAVPYADGMSTRERYPSDLTDRQWDNIEHLFPPERQPAGKPGRPRTYPRREVVNAVMYLSRAGCAWRMLPHDSPPWKTVSYYFYTWRDAGAWDELNDILRRDIRNLLDRDETPSACVIDSQSVNSAEKGAPASTRRASMAAS